MAVLTSSISDSLADVYSEWEDEFGFGPCGAYAALKRSEGWGKVAYCWAYETAENYYGGFGHYVVIDPQGDIIDLTNPLEIELQYDDIDILADDELPELVTEVEIEWLRARGV